MTNPNNPLWLEELQIQGNDVTFGDSKSGNVHAYYLTSLVRFLPLISIRLRLPYDISEGDYVIISHPDFLEAISPLVALRQQKGHRVSKINVQTIYDYYGHGKPVPEAITVFLRICLS